MDSVIHTISLCGSLNCTGKIFGCVYLHRFVHIWSCLRMTFAGTKKTKAYANCIMIFSLLQLWTVNLSQFYLTAYGSPMLESTMLLRVMWSRSTALPPTSLPLPSPGGRMGRKYPTTLPTSSSELLSMDWPQFWPLTSSTPVMMGHTAAQLSTESLGLLQVEPSILPVSQFVQSFILELPIEVYSGL